MIDITIKNSVSKVSGLAKDTLKVYKAFGVKNPNAFFLRRHMPKGWDGQFHFIKDNGNFDTGLLPRVIEFCKEVGIKYELHDERDKKFLKRAELVTHNASWEYRDYQLEAVKSVVDLKIAGKRFPRCTIKAATNAGKTGISAGIYLSYKKAPTIFLMNSKELFDQALEELPVLLGESVGQISSKKIEWADFMVVMVQTLKNRLNTITPKLANYKVLIVDECDLAANKTNKKVIGALHTTVVRVGLSGTVNASKLKKDQIKNWTIEGFFGPEAYDISNRALIDKGVSSEVAVRFIKGNRDTIEANGWQDEYEKGIVENKLRNKKCLKRVMYHLSKGRSNQLIIAQRHKHIMNLLDLFNKAKKKGLLEKDIVIDWVHHERKDRAKVVAAFKEGKVDILIGSMILKRGKNFPLMKFMINAGGGKGIENTLQLLGRAFRGCKHYEDFLDRGEYLSKHSRRRYIYYKNEKLKVSLPKGIDNLNNLNNKLLK